MGLCLFLELTFKQDGQTLSPLLEKVVVILLLILMVVICTLDVSEASLLMEAWSPLAQISAMYLHW